MPVQDDAQLRWVLETARYHSRQKPAPAVGLFTQVFVVPIGMVTREVAAEQLETIFPIAKVLVAVTTKKLTVDATRKTFCTGVHNMEVTQSFILSVSGHGGKKARGNRVVQHDLVHVFARFQYFFVHIFFYTGVDRYLYFRFLVFRTCQFLFVPLVSLIEDVNQVGSIHEWIVDVSKVIGH